MEVTWCSLLAVFTVITAATADVATSGYKLTVVYEKEGQLVEILHRYVTDTLGNKSQVDESVHRFLRIVKEERSRIDDIARWMGHPINAFHLVDRTVNGWRTIRQTINCSTCEHTLAMHEFHSAWKRITDKEDIWTSSDDVALAMKGLARLYETYDLDLKTMMSGTILNMTSSSPLISADIINIANYLELEDQIYWYETFLELDDVTERESILYKLAICYHMAGMSPKALNILTELQKTSTRPMGTIIKIIRQKVESSEKEKTQEMKVDPERYIDNVYRQLCQGHMQRVGYTPTLFCYNKATRIPYYTVKEETLSDVPRISRFHDIISDEEISHLQNTVKQNLTRSRVIVDGVDVFDDTRTAESAFLKTATNICSQLEKRIELLTGLDASVRKDIKTSESFQVVNYGIGGHYQRHFDVFYRQNKADITQESLGDRIATWMFYLNDVKAGGATVFPIINLRILPIKGSAVFWYNLMPSGEVDDRSQHASCPVILGTKWVTTKWIRETGQELRKPCKTHPMAEHF